MSVIQELNELGLVHQFTGLSLDEILSTPRTAYIGMDPTATAIHAGYLIIIRICSILKKHGHNIIVLIGGATAKIGDPTGKSAQRKVLDDETIANNIACLKKSIEKFFPGSRVVNNADWLSSLNMVEFLDKYTRHVTINTLIKLESFEKRLVNEQPLSVLESFYPIFQGYDFYHLNKTYGCDLQLGGSDQWSNILYGVDLVKRLSDKSVNGITCPLFLNSAGEKMGKTASGAIWLDETLTSVYDFWQYWRNTNDVDVVRYAKLFLDLEQKDLDINSFKKLFATRMTAFVHGDDSALKAEQEASAIFEKQDFGSAPACICSATDRLCDVLMKMSWCSSLSQAKDLIKSGAITVNDQKIFDPTMTVQHEEIICKGKKLYCRIVMI